MATASTTKQDLNNGGDGAQEARLKHDNISSLTPHASRDQHEPASVTPPSYGLYKRRFTGAFAIFVLNVVAGMNWPWFGPIANSTSQRFQISLDQVNWLGNIVALTYLVVAPVVPIICSRQGLRNCYIYGSAFLIAASWVRYAGTANSLNPGGSYTLLLIGQFLSAFAQCTFQVLVPKFSESWFDLRGRTTATMSMSIANPIGSALGQLISPLLAGPSESILVLGIISTAATPLVALIGSAPPTPPSYSGSHPSPMFSTMLRAICGKLPRPACIAPAWMGQSTELRALNTSPTIPADIDAISPSETPPKPADPKSDPSGVASATAETDAEARTRIRTDSNVTQELNLLISVEDQAYMTLRERIDFIILFMVFGALVGAVNAFALLSNEILHPYGYSEDTAGFMGAALLLSGILASLLASPLLDILSPTRPFLFSLIARSLVPPLSLAWLSLIWAVRANNAIALYAIFVIIGIGSLVMLPVGLELAVEVTRNAEGSGASMWFSGNLVGIVFVLVASALRAPSTASPPLHLHRFLIFLGACIVAMCSLIFAFNGRQARRERDVKMGAVGGGRSGDRGA